MDFSIDILWFNVALCMRLTSQTTWKNSLRKQENLQNILEWFALSDDEDSYDLWQKLH